MSDYRKDQIGAEDIHFDSAGNDSTFSRSTSAGGSQEVKRVNAGDIPLKLETRTLELFNGGSLDADNVDEAIEQIAASLALIHKFANEVVLDGITSKGSGAIITSLERQKLNSILSLGSGRIITDEERSKLTAISQLSNSQIQILNNIDNVGSPIGSIIIWPTATVPENYLECNGAAISRAQYSDLYAKLGTIYGVGDGTTTFNLPDLRGQFLRGWDHGAGVDTGRTIASSQDYATAAPQNTDAPDVSWSTPAGPHSYGFSRLSNVGENTTVLYVTDTGSGVEPDIISWDSGDVETRPKNVAMMYCIRYQNG